MKVYHVAVVESESAGGWCILETFRESNNSSAESYAESNYPDHEWYILDEKMQNINGG